MAVGKNKLKIKSNKKGGKKKVVDPFLKKDWYGNKAPAMFKTQQVGKTLVTRSSGNKFAADGLKGRVYVSILFLVLPTLNLPHSNLGR